jgi:hypothetical protein
VEYSPQVSKVALTGMAAVLDEEESGDDEADMTGCVDIAEGVGSASW